MVQNTLAGLSLRDLEYAVAIADLGQFSRAAERCGVSQAGLSDQVRKLETQLGAALFERTTRRVAVTAEGEVLLRQAREVIGAARVLLELARSRADPLAGPLRLGVIATLGPYYLPGVLGEVRQRYPKLELRLQEGLTEILVAEVLRGELDAVLLALPAMAEGLATAPLFFEPFRAVLPAAHGLAEQPRLALGDLAGEGLLLLEEGHCLRDQALSLCGVVRSRRETRFASSLEMLRHMIAAGEGYSLLPLLATRERSELDGLVRIRELADASEVGRQISLVWRRTDTRAAAFRELAQFLKSVAPAGTRALEGRAAGPSAGHGGRLPSDRIATRG